MRFLLITLFCFSCISLTAQEEALAKEALAKEPLTRLKLKQPNWTLKKVSVFADGTPEKVIFYAPIAGTKKEIPVKEMIYCQTGDLVKETDLMDETYHGPSVSYDARGRVTHIDFYHLGKLHGLIKEIYPNGLVKSSITYENGIKQGPFTDYYNNGKTEKTGCYKNNKLEGEVTSYYPTGEKKGVMFYEKGLLQGEALEWYEDGNIKSKKYYTFGLLNGKSKNIALTEYYPEKIVKETLDFTFGIPCGAHIKYHKNAKISFRTNYKQGKKEGSELQFSPDGSLIAEGEYLNGQPILKHYLKNEQGTVIYTANYNEKGILQEPILDFYDSGEKKLQYFKNSAGYQGEFLEWHPSGALAKKYQYLNNQLDGPQEEWFENGNKATEMRYTKGVRTGTAVTFYETGKKRSEAFYDSFGKLDGEERIFAEDGTLLFQTVYAHGLQSGQTEEWHANGNLKRVAHYSQGRLHGKEETFYDNKQEKSRANYINDLPDGVSRTFFEDGTLQSEKQFVMGVAVGTHIENYPKENTSDLVQLEKKLYYKDGKLEGEQKSFYKNGQMRALLNYKSNVLHGKKALWDSEGNLLEEAEYSMGLLNGRYFVAKENGKEIIYHYKDNLLDGLHLVYYPEHPLFGKIKAYEACYEKGLIEGEVSEYNEAGTKIVSTFYEHGLKNGPVTLYSHDGKVKLATEFQDDNQNGLTVEYFPSGNLQREVLIVDNEKEGEEKCYFDSDEGLLYTLKTFKKGLLNGISKQWNEEGTLIFEAEYLDGKRHGLFAKYDEQGNPYVLHRYEDDTLIEKF